MRRALGSLSAIVAAGALVTAGGAFSIFSDTASSAAGFVNGTVKLAVNGQNPETDIFALAGPCTKRFQNKANPTDALNLGTVNNTGCASTFTVHNSGSLPFELSGTTVSDSNPEGLTCVTSTITPADIAATSPLLPGADRVLHVSTATTGDGAGCQGLTDKVTVSLVATETKAGRPVTGRIGYYLTPGGGFQEAANYQIAAITAAGGTPVAVTTLDTATLSTLDGLTVENVFGSTGALLAAFPTISDQVKKGMQLNMQDWSVSSGLLLDNPGLSVVYAGSGGALNVGDNSTLITTGPGGAITSGLLTGGTSTFHGYTLAGPLPAGAKKILVDAADATHVVTFCYPDALGSVTYSTIPLGYYAGAHYGYAALNTAMTKYATNVAAFIGHGGCSTH